MPTDKKSFPIGDIISKGWYFYRPYIKSFLLLSFLASFLCILASFIVSLPATQIENNSEFSTLYQTSCLIGIVMYLLGWYVSKLFLFPISRAFRNIFIYKKTDMNEVLSFTKSRITSIFSLGTLVFLESAIVSAIFGIVTIIFIIIIALLLYTLKVNPIFLSHIFLYLMSFWMGLVSLFFSLKIIIYVFEEKSIIDTYKYFFRVFLRYPIKAFMFIFLLILIEYILMIAFNLPFSIYQYYKQIVYGAGITTNFNILELLASHIWMLLCSIILLPYITACIAYFYFSIKSKEDGLDLSIELSNLDKKAAS